MLILALDTSTSAGSVAILEDSEVIGEIFLQLKTTHSERVLSTIDILLKYLNIEISDIDIFVAGIGPGSFTGIRIGISIIKGFAAVSHKSTVGISSLDALAMEYKNSGDFYSFIEGRKDEVFIAKFRRHNNKIIEKLDDYKVAKKHTIKINSNNSIGIFKDNYFSNLANKGNLFAHNFGILGFYKYTQVENSEILSCNNLIPLYLKKSDAETNITKKL